MGDGALASPSVTESTPTVRAAGGVITRQRYDGALEVAVVHRPKYSDWSFPKGKLDDGETEQEAALREVLEETGLRCRSGRDLGTVSYTDPKGRPKTVHYWEMAVTGGDFTPNHEVDELRWLRLPEAGEALTHERDRDVLDRLAG